MKIQYRTMYRLIMDRDRTILYSKEIERGLAARIEQFFVKKAYDMSWCIYSGDDWLSPDRSDPRILREESIVEAQSREGSVKDLAPGKGVNKFLCICAPGTILRIEEEVKSAFPEVAVVKSSDILLEIMAKGISKAEAVKRFCAHLGISPDETIAFGDNFNDVEMLEAVGRSYVMGNAPEEILDRGCPGADFLKTKAVRRSEVENTVSYNVQADHGSTCLVRGSFDRGIFCPASGHLRQSEGGIQTDRRQLYDDEQ